MRHLGIDIKFPDFRTSVTENSTSVTNIIPEVTDCTLPEIVLGSGTITERVAPVPALGTKTIEPEKTVPENIAPVSNLVVPVPEISRIGN